MMTTTNQPVNPVEQRHKKLAYTLYHLFRQTQEPFTVETIAQLISNAEPQPVMPASHVPQQVMALINDLSFTKEGDGTVVLADLKKLGVVIAERLRAAREQK
jgi:hypothetical protein